MKTSNTPSLDKDIKHEITKYMTKIYSIIPVLWATYLGLGIAASSAMQFIFKANKFCESHEEIPAYNLLATFILCASAINEAYSNSFYKSLTDEYLQKYQDNKDAPHIKLRSQIKTARNDRTLVIFSSVFMGYALRCTLPQEQKIFHLHLLGRPRDKQLAQYACN